MSSEQMANPAEPAGGKRNGLRPPPTARPVLQLGSQGGQLKVLPHI